MSKDKKKEIVGYRQQSGKLSFSRPGSGGKNLFSEPRNEKFIPESQGGDKKQPWGKHRHDEYLRCCCLVRSNATID